MGIEKHGLGLVLAVLCAPFCAHAQWQYSGYLEASIRGLNADAEGVHWLEGGYRTLGHGSGGELEGRLGLRYEAQESSITQRAVVHLLARRESSLARRAGLVEAYYDVGALDLDGWRLRAGQAFAGTSRENIEEFWQTPYSVQYSAINSWLAEEFRPIGVNFARRVNHGSASTDLEASIYVGNDTGPAMLAWRGFAVHRRLSVYGETLPLPPLQSVRFGPFSAQRTDGSQPFGPDLDSRPGWALRLRHRIDGGLGLSLFATSNRGDQDLHDADEYAWENRFLLAGFDWPISEDWTLIGEAMLGKTKMGFAPGPNVEARFDSQYLLLSKSLGSWVFSARAERFAVHEADFSAENNEQRGRVWTLSALHNAGAWRFGWEWSDADIRREGNLDERADLRQGGQQLEFVVRYYF